MSQFCPPAEFLFLLPPLSVSCTPLSSLHPHLRVPALQSTPCSRRKPLLTAVLYEPAKSPYSRSSTARYIVREAFQDELFTVADVRCSAFYDYPADQHFYPARRREIYLALVDRVGRGNKCIVAVDRRPPKDWAPFASVRDELVVGAVDASLYEREGRRFSFWKGLRGPQAVVTVYISSMAVREEWRGRGLARMLLEAVIKEGKEKGLHEVLLHVDEQNVPALRLYQSEGFEKWKETKGWFIPTWLGGLAKREHTLMVKNIAEQKSSPNLDVGL